MATQEQLDRMSKRAEVGGAKAPELKVAFLKFNGNTGEFKISRKNASGEYEDETLKDPVKMTILKKRKLLSEFGNYFTPEYESVRTPVKLFKIDGGVKLETTDTPSNLRIKYPTLRTHEIAYALVGDETVKFEMKGGSLKGYYDYLTVLKEENLHTFQQETVMTVGTGKNSKTGKAFKKIEFAKGAEVDLDKVEAAQVDIVAQLDARDKFYEEKPEAVGPVQSATDKAFDEMTSDDEDNDIPF